MGEVFLAGREPLPDMREFWQSWFQYLLAQSGDQAARLLEESLAWQNRDSQAEVARKYASTHPSLYLHLISALNREKDYEEALSMGKEALSLAPVQFRIRSQIALETAQAAMMLGKRSYGEECWFEAFRSDSTAVNYLRLLEANESGENFLQQAAEHWRSCKKSEKAYGEMIPQELREHILTSDEKKFLELLDGKFAATINWCAKDKEGVGWSGSFIKDAVSIFLLLLYQEDTPQIALDGFLGELCSSTHFKAEDYFKGMGVQKAGETPQCLPPPWER